MIIANFVTMKPEMAHSRTYEDFSKFLGAKSHRIGIVAKMRPYEQMTASYLTEGMGNVYRNSSKGGNKYQKIDALSFEWELEQNNIEYITFADHPVGTGINGSEIEMAFTRRYYEENDTFMIEGSKQQCLVVEAPIRKSDSYWLYRVVLMGADRQAELDTNACYKGAKTRWLSNVQPEFHERGSVKYQSNAQKCRQWLTEIRCDIDASSRYEALEQTFIKLSRGSDANGWESKIFAWPEKKRILLDNFMSACNNAMLWQRGTMDANGKATVTDRQGRPLIAGDGVIPQVERYASSYNYTKLTASLLQQMILDLSLKCKSSQGNTFTFVTNTILFNQLNLLLGEFLRNHSTDGGYIWSKTDGKIKVGATYNAYEFSGNIILLHADRALDIEYPDKGFGVMVDLTGDMVAGRPAIEKFTLSGRELIENTVSGVATRSGEVASPVAGVKYTMSGYAGIAVYSPFRSVLVCEN